MATNTEQLLAYLQTPGLTDAQIANEVNRLGVSAAQVSQLTGVPVSEVQSRLATPTNEVGRTVQETTLYNFLQKPGLTDQQIAAEVNRLGLKADQISKMTGVPVGEINARLNLISTQTAAQTKAAADAKALADAQKALATAEAARLAALKQIPTTPTNTANFSTFTNWLKSTPGLTDTQIAAEMNRLGITTGQVGQITGMPGTDIENRFRATTPFAGATQGFAQNFNNYQSIPIGSQYNPFAVGGSGSPYAQIMGQMRPVGNPYQNVVGNLPMGGYNPGLYDQIAAANLAKAEAEKLATGTTTFEGGGGGGDGGGGGGGGGGTGAGAGTGNAMAKGGYVHGGLMFGANPPGPDDGAVNLDIGEYVIKKSSVNKYGKGLLDMINEGKVPAKKMKSLLG
jgi:hypothetical protein